MLNGNNDGCVFPPFLLLKSSLLDSLNIVFMRRQSYNAFES